MPGTRNDAFSRVTVDHMLRAGTRVSWRLQPDFAEQDTLIFQLQLSETGIPNADDWIDIGDPAINVISLEDPTQRDFGSVPCSHYRVRMNLNGVDYFSPPEGCWGRLNRHDWLKARAMVRRERLREKLFAGTWGWLFKRRKKTEKVQNVNEIDFGTGEVIKSRNSSGVGTDRVGGYFAPFLMQMDLVPQGSYQHRDDNVGMTNDIQSAGRTVAFPEVEHGDVWANATSDARYAVHAVKCVAHLRGVPLFVSAELKQVDLGDPIYELDLPEVPSLTTLGREEF